MPQLISVDGLKLYYESDPLESPSAVALIVHGFGDHCKRYQAFSELLNEWNILCYRFDYRGHGRSQGKRGHIMHFDDGHVVSASPCPPTSPPSACYRLLDERVECCCCTRCCCYGGAGQSLPLRMR